MQLFGIHIVLLAGIILALVAVAIILQQRRTPQSAFAWLLAILIMTYIALPLFFALGMRRAGGHYAPIRFTDEDKAALPSFGHIEETFRHLDMPAARAGNAFRLLETGETAYAGVMEVVQSAQATLDATFYIVSKDPVGVAFVDALTERARAGVEVRLIIDRLGTLRPPREALRRLEAAGGQVHFFSPLIHMPDRGHLNLRNHRKMVIADRARVFAGGMNVAEDYMSPAPVPHQWCDLAFTVEGPVVQTYIDIFHSDWKVREDAHETPPPAVTGDAGGDAVGQLIASGPDTLEDEFHDGLVRAIYLAERRVWIATPYFIPTEMLINALSVAARRDIDLRIIVPEASNQKIADHARGAYLRVLGNSGARILRYMPGMLHAKMGVIDDVAWVGSANFDVRSMMLNFESALFLYDPASVAGLEQWFLRHQAECEEGIERPGLAGRLVEGLFRLSAPVL